MPKSVLDAIRQGIWDFEPMFEEQAGFESTGAMPGTREKLEALAERLRRGLPLWHPLDRQEYDEPPR
jgi:hypothetical protein